MSRCEVALTLQQKDYDAIENTIMETVQGQQFLAEFSRRNSALEAEGSIQEIARLHASATNAYTNEKLQNIWRDLATIIGIITKARHELITQMHENCLNNHFAQVTNAPNTRIANKEHAESKEIKTLNLVEEKINAIIRVIQLDIHRYVARKTGKVIRSGDNIKCQQVKVDSKQKDTIDPVCNARVHHIRQSAGKNRKDVYATTRGWAELIEKYGQPKAKQTREIHTSNNKIHPITNNDDLGITWNMLKSEISAIHSQHKRSQQTNIMTSDKLAKKLNNITEV